MLFSSRLKPALLCIASALLLMGICLYNGYPINGGDTHAYLDYGFADLFPTDRSPFYGSFIRVTSMWSSLWYTIFTQCLLVAFLLLRYIRLLYGGSLPVRHALVVVIAMSAFTCVGWVGAELMPDIFGGILMLAVLLYFFDAVAGKVMQILYVLIIILAIIMHSSHFAILGLFAGTVLIYALLRRHKVWITKCTILLSASVGFYLLMCTINHNHGYGFIFSKSANQFTMAKFAESGILNLYLDDNCAKKPLMLCDCRDEITPYAWDYMWPAPTTKLSKVLAIDSNGSEAAIVVHEVFTTPKYLKIYAQRSVISTVRQLLDAQVGDRFCEPLSSWRNQLLHKYFGDEFNQFASSRQSIKQLDTHYFNIVYNLFFVLTTIAVLLCYRRTGNELAFQLYCAILLFFLVNAFITGTLSMVSFRYQYRIIWILPATNIIMLLRYIRSHHSQILPAKEDNKSRANKTI